MTDFFAAAFMRQKAAQEEFCLTPTPERKANLVFVNVEPHSTYFRLGP
jgi:hypothetical protein